MEYCYESLCSLTVTGVPEQLGTVSPAFGVMDMPTEATTFTSYENFTNQESSIALSCTGYKIYQKDANDEWQEMLPVDLLVIADCLWSRAEDRDEIRKIVDEAVKVRSGEGASEMLDWNKRFTAFENSILNPAPKPDEESGVKVVNGVRSYCIAACRATNSQEVYIPQAWENTEREFHPLDTDGYSCKDVICKTLGKGNFEVWNGNGTKIVFTAKQRGRVSAATMQGAVAQLEKARELLDEVIKIGYSMVAKGGVSAAGYPFVDRKRLDAVNEGCEKNRAMISEGKVRCEYLVHRLGAAK